MIKIPGLNLEISLRAILIAVAVIAPLLVIGLRSCADNRQGGAQGGQDSRSGAALAETAMDAAQTVIDQGGEETSVDQLVAATQQEIDNAPSDQAAGDAARRAICELVPDARHDPACAVQ